MRIGLFSDTYTPEINGVVSSIVTLQRGLEAAGHDVFIVTTHPSLLSMSYDHHVLRLPGIELKKMYGYVLSSPIHIKAYQEIKEMKLDLIHAHTEFGIGIFARIVSRLLSLPLVITYHTTYEDYTHYVNVFNSKAFEKLARKTVSKLSQIYIDTSDAIISPSTKTQRMLMSYGVKKDIDVIPTGLDLSRFDPQRSSPHQIAQLKNSLHIPLNEPIILYVGRIAKEKSIDLVIEGFSQLDFKSLSAHLVIVGGGPELESLQRLAQSKACHSRIHFTGKKNAEDVPLFYHSADLFVSASLTETQGMTFVEAFASHTPVLARHDDVLNDLIIEGHTGYFFANPVEFTDKIKQYLILSSEKQEAMKQAAYEHSLPYNRATFIEKVMAVYQRAFEDVKESMELETVKQIDDVVECHLSKRQRSLDVVVSREMFVEKGLRKGNTVTKETIDELLENEQFVKAYQLCIRKLAIKDRSLKEMYDYLTENTTLSIREINTLIDHLEAKGYLDDQALAQSMVNSYRVMLQGKFKMIRNLRKKGIPQSIIDSVMGNERLEDEVEKAVQWATKAKGSIKDKSMRALKQSLNQKMIHQGFDFDVIEIALARLNFSDEEKQELDRLRKVASKAYKRYASKHQGTALRNALFTYLDHQGFSLDDIYIVLNEMELDT